MHAKSVNYRSGCTGSIRSSDPAHPRDDDRVRFVNTTRKNRNKRTEGKVLFSHADAHSDTHERHVTLPDKITGHRTTFHTYDIDSDDQEQRKLFDRLWKLQVGRGHTWENKQKHIVRQDATWKRCDAILQFCEVPELEREVALRATLSRDLQRFSRHYKGAAGACIGFALFEMFDDPGLAKRSWVAQTAVDAVPGFDRGTVHKLIDYVFNKYDKSE